MALADIADLEARLGRKITNPAEITQAQAFLADASAKVSSYTRQEFALITGDEVVLRPVGTLLRLPERPVVAVTSVTAIGCDGQAEFPLAGYCWDGSDLIDLAGWSGAVINYPDWWDDAGGSDSYRVIYDHGYAVIPVAVIAVVCGMVNRVLSSPSPVEGMVTEKIGQYSYGLQQGAGANGLTVRLTDDDKHALARYRRTASTIAVSVN